MRNHALERIVIVPRNGYVNRLQAWASASILAQSFGVPLAMFWEPESVSPAGPKDLFDGPIPLTDVIDRAELERVLGASHESVPRYLHSLQDRGVLSLAGHDRGEQAFMMDVLAVLKRDRSLKTLVVIAGGQFAIPGTPNFQELRSYFYNTLPWKQDILHPTENLVKIHQPYVALHVRGTDRSLQAPTKGAIRRAVARQHGLSGLDSLFVTADSAESAELGIEIGASLGAKPWISETTIHDRSDIRGGKQAMIDWLILARSQGIVYSATSTFAHEAAVAGRCLHSSIPLQASRFRESVRRCQKVAETGIRRIRS